MTEVLSGPRIVVPETWELDQMVRMLEERGAEAIPCPIIAIRDAPDAESGSGREVELVQGFRRVTIAAVGPELETLGVQVDIMPRENAFFMKPLVRELAAALMKVTN